MVMALSLVYLIAMFLGYVSNSDPKLVGIVPKFLINIQKRKQMHIEQLAKNSKIEKDWLAKQCSHDVCLQKWNSNAESFQ